MHMRLTVRPHRERLVWWLSASALAIMVVCFLPVKQIELAGKQLQGTVGSYGTPPPSPGVAIHALWTQDYVSPAIRQAVTPQAAPTPNTIKTPQFPEAVPGALSNCVAGGATVHISFNPGTMPYVYTYGDDGTITETSYGWAIDQITVPIAIDQPPTTFISPSSYWTSTTWNPWCGDPDPNQPDSPWMVYWDFPWVTGVLQNGSQTITVSISQTEDTYTYNPITGQSTSQSTTLPDVTGQVTVDVENALITSTTPANPKVLGYLPNPPAGGSGGGASNAVVFSTFPYTLTCNVTAAAVAIQPAVVTIYDTTQTPIRTIVLDPPTAIGGDIGGGTTCTFVWDGYDDFDEWLATSPEGQQMSEYYGDPKTVPSGLYTFQFRVGELGLSAPNFTYNFDPDPAGFDIYSGDDGGDTDKSVALSFGVPATSVTVEPKTSDAAGTNVLVGFTLADAYNNPPSACLLDIYESWDLADILPGYALPTGLGLNTALVDVPPASNPDPNDITRGTYLVYLVSPRDADALYDRGSRNRFALQHNNKQIKRTVLTWGGHYCPSPVMPWTQVPWQTEDLANQADALAKNIGYNLWRVRGSWTPVGDYTSAVAPENPNNLIPTPAQILFTLLNPLYGTGQQSNTIVRAKCPNGLLGQCIDVAIFCGHGSEIAADAGKWFAFGQNTADDTRDSTDSQWFLAETPAVATGLTNNGVLGQRVATFPNAGTWGNLQTTGQPVQLILWVGCEAARNFAGAGLPQMSVNEGACCSVGFQQTWSPGQASVFLDQFAKEDMQGPVKSGKTVLHAVNKGINTARVGLLGGGGPWTKLVGFAGNRYFILPQ